MQALMITPQWRRRLIAIVVVVAAALAAFWLIRHIPRTLTVFLIAAFIAFGVNPIVRWLARRMPRPLAIAIVYVGLLGTIVVLILLVLPALLAQISVLATNTPSYIGLLQNWIDDFQTMLRQRLGHEFLPSGYADLKTLIAEKLTPWLTISLAALTTILVDTFTAAFIAISAIILSAFFVIRGEHVTDGLYELFPVQRRVAIRRLSEELAQMFSAYVSGQVALCVITGAFIYVISALFGFKFALLLGILSGIAYAVPYVGQVFAHVVAILLAAPQGGQMILIVNVVVFAVGRVSDNLLVPKIMSESVGVSPIVVMFAVFAGGELFGLVGLLLGIPAAALVKIAWRFFRESWLMVPSETQPPEPVLLPVETAVATSERPEVPASPQAPRPREA